MRPLEVVAWDGEEPLARRTPETWNLYTHLTLHVIDALIVPIRAIGLLTIRSSHLCAVSSNNLLIDLLRISVSTYKNGAVAERGQSGP